MIYYPSTGGHGKAYEGYGIDEERGAVLVIRPDGCTLSRYCVRHP